MTFLEKIVLTFEELESLRLKDVEHLEQAECADRMHISRSVFQRILSSAHLKVASALLQGKALVVEGGKFRVAPQRFTCPNGHVWDAPADYENEIIPVCPVCHGSINQKKSYSRKERNVPMKYAVPIEQGKLNPHFGHSAEYMLVNLDESGKVTADEVVASPGHACGYLPGWLASKGVNVILAGGMGMTPRLLFQQNGVEVVLGVQETDPKKAAVAHFKGTLAFGANSCEHGDQACDHSHHAH
jgi:predicted DNA-binding protein (UPF0251 family)/predicted Fe-Mo cluster-binding NifX family protein